VTCEKVTYLIEKGYLTRLNISEKLQVKLHSFYCTCCTNYPKDSAVINEMLSKLNENNESLTFSEKEKKELRELLEKMD
jgi:hypothetical protein